MTVKCKLCGAKWEIHTPAMMLSLEGWEYWKNVYSSWQCPFGCGYFPKKGDTNDDTNDDTNGDTNDDTNADDID